MSVIRDNDSRWWWVSIAKLLMNISRLLCSSVHCVLALNTCPCGPPSHMVLMIAMWWWNPDTLVMKCANATLIQNWVGKNPEFPSLEFSIPLEFIIIGNNWSIQNYCDEASASQRSSGALMPLRLPERYILTSLLNTKSHHSIILQESLA